MGFFTPDLDKIEKESDTSEILKYINHSSSAARLKAFQVLFKELKREDVLDKLYPMVNDPDRKVSTYVIIKFLELGDDRVLERSRAILSENKLNDKIKILYALTDYSGKDMINASNIILQALNEQKMIIKVEAIKALGSYKGDLIIGRLKEYLLNKNYQIRLETVKSIAKAGGDSIVDNLVGALIDNHPQIRVAARKALEDIGTEKALEFLKNSPFMEMVKCMNGREYTRKETVREIGENEIEEGLPLLVRACKDEYKSVRIESVRSLGKFRNPDYINLLELMLEDKYYDVRIEALYSLEKIKSVKALESIEKAYNDKNSNVRTAAKEAHNNLRMKLEQENIKL